MDICINIYRERIRKRQKEKISFCEVSKGHAFLLRIILENNSLIYSKIGMSF